MTTRSVMAVEPRSLLLPPSGQPLIHLPAGSVVLKEPSLGRLIEATLNQLAQPRRLPRCSTVVGQVDHSTSHPLMWNSRKVVNISLSLLELVSQPNLCFLP